MSLSYRARSRLGLVSRKPRRLTLAKAQEIRRKYFRREAKQLELALEYEVIQATISKVISNCVYQVQERHSDG